MKAAVKHYVLSGGRHIDGAAGYGNEHEVGEAVEELVAQGVCSRADLFITSKLWVMSARPGDCARALAKTLADLRTPYVDLYLIHWPFSLPLGSPFPPPPENIVPYSADAYLALWRALEAEVDAGRVRALGCSNMSVSKMEALEAQARHPICANQVECHPALPQTELRGWCAARGIALTAYSPLGSPARPPRWRKEDNPIPLEAPAVLAAAASTGRTPAQVLLRWQWQRGVIAIPKSVTPERITQNLHAALGPDLDEGVMSALNGMEVPEGLGRIILGCASPHCAPQQNPFLYPPSLTTHYLPPRARASFQTPRPDRHGKTCGYDGV